MFSCGINGFAKTLILYENAVKHNLHQMFAEYVYIQFNYLWYYKDTKS